MLIMMLTILAHNCKLTGDRCKPQNRIREGKMANRKGSGLMMVWCEVPPEIEGEFNRWYNEEHIAERLEVPGFLSAARYEAVSGGPKHLAVYEIESPAVVESEVYLRYRGNPTEWSKRMSPEFTATKYVRNVYRMIHPSALTDEIAAAPMAPALQIGRMDIPAEVEAEWNDWYNAVYVPNYETVPGVRRGRRYQAAAGEPKYLTMYEFDDPGVSSGDAWLAQQTAHPDNARMRAAMIHLPESPGIWRKTFELGA